MTFFDGTSASVTLSKNTTVEPPDLPIKKSQWSYEINSSRNPAKEWQNDGSYVSFGSEWETTPYGAGVTLDSDFEDVLACEEIDWHYVVQNG